jgi:ankyrin repeat protein
VVLFFCSSLGFFFVFCKACLQSFKPQVTYLFRPAVCAQMLQQGMDVDSADYDGRTALMLACVKGHREVAVLLLGAGADPMRRSVCLSARLPVFSDVQLG